MDAFAFEFGRGGLVNTDKFLNYLLAEVGENTFEKLDIPLIVVATDFWGAEEVVFEKGELIPAIKASMAVPGIFAPISIGDKSLVDGGVVNLVPYDHILDRCDVSIVVNVAKARTPGKSDPPTVLESILGTFEIMQMAALTEKMKHRKPDIYIHPEISDVRMFDFNKVEDVYLQAQPAIEELRALVQAKILDQ
jgi:NTE family protein